MKAGEEPRPPAPGRLSRAAALLLAPTLGASFAGAWVFLDLAALPLGVFGKQVLWGMSGVILLAGVRRLTVPTPVFDVAWVVLYVIAALVGLTVVTFILGLGGIR